MTKKTFVYLQYNEVFWRVWLECKFLTAENFESISFTRKSIDFCWFDGDGEQARVLNSEGPFESEVWLLDFCLWKKMQTIRWGALRVLWYYNTGVSVHHKYAETLVTIVCLWQKYQDLRKGVVITSVCVPAGTLKCTTVCVQILYTTSLNTQMLHIHPTHRI